MIGPPNNHAMQMPKFLRSFLISFLALTLVLISVEAAMAKVVVMEDEEPFRLSSEEILDDDLFVFAEEVTIDGILNGDLYVAAGVVRLNGTVNGDVYSVGGLVEVHGTVAQDLISAGGNLVLTGAEIGETAILFGGDTRVDSGSHIGGNLIFGSGTLDVSGDVEKALLGGTGLLRISGIIGRDILVGAEDVRLESGAEVKGNIKYRSANELELSEGATVLGEITQLAPKVKKTGRFFPGFGIQARYIFAIWSFLGALIIGLLAIYAFPKQTKGIAVELREHPWLSLFLGIGALVLTPVLAVLLLITVIGIPLAAILAVEYAIFWYFAKLVIGLLLGLVLMETFNSEKVNPYLSFAVGLLVYYLLVALPYVGPFIAIFSLIFGMGALVLFQRDLILKARKSVKAVKKKR